MKMFGAKLKQLIHTNKHSLSTVISIILGLTFGILFRNYVWPDGPESVDKQIIRYLELPGLIFLRSFRLLLAPLLISSLTTSFFVDKTEQNDQQQQQQQQPQSNEYHHSLSPSSPSSPSSSSSSKFDLQKVTALSFIFFTLCSTFAIILGITTVIILEPGVIRSNETNVDDLIKISLNKSSSSPSFDSLNNKLRIKQESFKKSHYQTDSVYNILLNIFPDNPLTPFFMRSYEQTEFIWPQNLSEINDANFIPRNKIKTLHTFSPNMLGICVLSLSLGFLLSKLPPYKTETIRSLLNELDLIVKCLLDIMIRIMPFGMFCWMFTESLKMKSMNNMVSQLFYFYIIAFILFMSIWFIFYPILYFLICHKNPYKLHQGTFPALVIAFASSSSALALPVTMETMEENLRLPKIISKMVLPLGMTIHMNGPAMYYPMVGVFVSQIKQVPQNILSLSIVGLFSLVMSMGFPGVPAGGATIVNHLAFASVLGIDNPQDILFLVVTFDWFFERVRTVTNVMGDCFVAKCVEKLSRIDGIEGGHHHGLSLAPYPSSPQTSSSLSSSSPKDMMNNMITEEDMALNNFEKQY